MSAERQRMSAERHVWRFVVHPLVTDRAQIFGVLLRVERTFAPARALQIVQTVSMRMRLAVASTIWRM
jgi:hypothetical protein